VVILKLYSASKILLLSGISEDIALNAIRLSIGRDTSLSDIDVFVQDLKNAVLKL
jgi:selenocysteine lyase